MPGKTVRFNDSNIEYSPVPPTPSPTYSASSLPSSSGPITPPTPFQHNSPLPPAYSLPVHINPLLGFQPYSQPLLYNVSLPPSSLVANSPGRTGFSSRALAEPATQPPLPSLIIICHEFPWRITVTASTSLGVTCADVLDSVYRSLRLTVSAAEYGTLPSMEAQKLVNAAFHTRCQRCGNYEEEKRKGLKRIDFLAGRNRFLGLSSTKQGPQIWQMDLAL